MNDGTYVLCRDIVVRMGGKNKAPKVVKPEMNSPDKQPQQQPPPVPQADNYVIVVEHDLAVIDYMSDFVCCLWGAPGASGCF